MKKIQFNSKFPFIRTFKKSTQYCYGSKNIKKIKYVNKYWKSSKNKCVKFIFHWRRARSKRYIACAFFKRIQQELTLNFETTQHLKVEQYRDRAMASVWRRFQRVNKRAAKFQFTASFHELKVETTSKW